MRLCHHDAQTFQETSHPSVIIFVTGHAYKLLDLFEEFAITGFASICRGALLIVVYCVRPDHLTRERCILVCQVTVRVVLDDISNTVKPTRYI